MAVEKGAELRVRPRCSGVWTGSLLQVCCIVEVTGGLCCLYAVGLQQLTPQRKRKLRSRKVLVSWQPQQVYVETTKKYDWGVRFVSQLEPLGS